MGNPSSRNPLYVTDSARPVPNISRDLPHSRLLVLVQSDGEFPRVFVLRAGLKRAFVPGLLGISTIDLHVA